MFSQILGFFSTTNLTNKLLKLSTTQVFISKTVFDQGLVTKEMDKLKDPNRFEPLGPSAFSPIFSFPYPNLDPHRA